ncbi:WecB/TagA/CpsF family glycosyltransferase [Alteromonas confluentis]|uniref:Glycosyl transferase n=1 Tax=Alteromonas confluentis TaxID=1656094 RepID=A0A1E7Z8P5_9ALTE|nr:WecB/TagA/CpsF family glycosyltransferase [Alteromonas confluentis]OFC69923.1 glycosyl transferase [Alteromonas confluentis]
MRMEDVIFTRVGGVKTACLSRKQLVDLIVQRSLDYKDPFFAFSAPLTVLDSNGQAVSLANSNAEFKKALEDADIVHADGQSIVSFSRWFSDNPIPERTATTDTIHDIPTYFDGTLRHFLLGGTKQVVKQCGDILSSKYANFKVAGVRDGYFSAEEESRVVDEINEAKPDVLWVGLGKPKEQRFVKNNKNKLKVPVIITCGGCYNYITGDYKRAPEIFQKTGFEWLHRAATEPRKLLWRYLTTNPHTIYCVLKHRHKKHAE